MNPISIRDYVKMEIEKDQFIFGYGKPKLDGKRRDRCSEVDN